MDLIKDRGHYNSPVSFDPVQQRFCPAEEEQIRHQENFPVCHFSVHKISSKITVFIWTWSASKRNNSLNKEGNRYFIGGGCVPRLPTLLLFSWGKKQTIKLKHVLTILLWLQYGHLKWPQRQLWHAPNRISGTVISPFVAYVSLCSIIRASLC